MKRLSLLLIFIPLAIASSLLDFHAWMVFAFVALGIIPLAWIWGRATEELVLHVGPQVGGLLNALWAMRRTWASRNRVLGYMYLVYEKEEGKWDGFQTPKSG